MPIGALSITESDVVAGQKIFASTEQARSTQLETWANDEVVAKAVNLDTTQTIAEKKTFAKGIDCGDELISSVKNPIDAQDAATKASVAAAVAAVTIAVYDSGWFAVENGTSYELEHGLGSVALNVTVLQAPGTIGDLETPDPDLVHIAHPAGVASVGEYGPGVRIASSADLVVTAGNVAAIRYLVEDSGLPAIAVDGHYRVLAAKLD